MSGLEATFFHHTTSEGLEGIEQEGKIKESSSGGKDAAFGPGVYLTSLGPEESIETVAENNFDGAAPAMIEKGKCDIIIEVDVPDRDVRKAETDRDVYVHSGDIPKSNIVNIYERDENGEAIIYK